MKYICLGVVVIIFVILFIVPLFKWWMVSNNLIKVRSKYFDALGKLKQMPNNTSLKQHTLVLGQKYVYLTQEIVDSNATQKVKGFIHYNELTLMKDIEDACGIEKSIFNKNQSNTQFTEERLIKLKELKEKFIIREQEYKERRKKILDEI